MYNFSQPTKLFWRKSKKKANKRKIFGISLMSMLLGIFLLPQLAFLSTITPETIIKLSNEERSKHGLSTLSANQLLSQAAYNKANAILESQHFTHQINDRKFSAWIKDTGYKYSYVGENLAVDFITAEGVIKAWLESETHKKNLLNKQFKEIGIAVVEGEFQGQNTILVVQIFGTPLIPSGAKIPNKTNFVPTPINLEQNRIESRTSANTSWKLVPQFTYSLFENTIVQAKYLPGFLGQGQQKLLGILSLASITTLSQHAITFISLSLILTLLLYFSFYLSFPASTNAMSISRQKRRESRGKS